MAHDGVEKQRVEAILIAGPTASGKSALALALAARFGGSIVNADSMQVYRDLHILTARPSQADESQAPHGLYGHVDGAENYSVGRWLADVEAQLRHLRGEGRLPIFVGGTGLYFKALCQGLSDIPPVPAELRARLRAAAEGMPASALHARLASVDPAASARLQPGDRQRILRALEVHAATDRPLSYFLGQRRAPLLRAEHCARLFLTPARAETVARIERRFDAMMAAGALEEVVCLAARNLPGELPVMRAHGAPGLLAHLRGDLSLADAIAKGKRDTRAYAKRQLTWFRHQMADWTSVAPEQALASALEQIDAVDAGAKKKPGRSRA